MENIDLNSNMSTDINSLREIINNEQNYDTVFKETCDVDDVALVLNNRIREAITKTENAKNEKIQLTTQSDQLRTDIEVQMIHLEALKSQIENAKEMNKNIKTRIESGIADVWKLRKSLTNVSQVLLDEFDVWALMTRHVHLTPTPAVETKRETPEPVRENHEERLKLAKERKQRALAERDRLRAEPDVADDFVRIRKALRYFSEIHSNERQ